MSEFDEVTYEIDGDLALIGLNRPTKANAQNRASAEALHTCVERAQREAKVGVIFGHGKHFCAGLDLEEHARVALGEPKGPISIAPGPERIARGRIPFVVAIQGACVGGGFEIAASAHVRVCDESAFFALPEAARGIYVGGGGSVRIARLIGASRMMDMMLTGRVRNAEEADQMGVVHYRTPAGGALDKAKQIASGIAKNAALSNFAVISALPRIQDLSYDDGLFFEQLIVSHTQSDASQDGIREFLEKRATRLNPGEEKNA